MIWYLCTRIGFALAPNVCSLANCIIYVIGINGYYFDYVGSIVI